MSISKKILLATAVSILFAPAAFAGKQITPFQGTYVANQPASEMIPNGAPSQENKSMTKGKHKGKHHHGAAAAPAADGAAKPAKKHHHKMKKDAAATDATAGK